MVLTNLFSLFPNPLRVDKQNFQGMYKTEWRVFSGGICGCVTVWGGSGSVREGMALGTGHTVRESGPPDRDNSDDGLQ